MKFHRAVSVLAAIVLPTVLAAAGGGGPAMASSGVIKPVISCSALVGAVPGAAGTVTSAAVVSVPLAGKQVRFCDARGVITPETHFEVLLPTATWHGQYVQEGCSTLCGSVQLYDYPDAGILCGAVDNGELVLAADDEGHTGGPADGLWAKNSLALRIVFGLTSEHSLARMAGTLIKAYYGRPASYRYYDGCSTGGREALMLAQRYPADFNGIIAGAPAMNMAPLAAFFASWVVRSNTAPDGHQIVTAENIPALHAAVLRACGNSHGIITDPRRCGFDPDSIRCSGATRSGSCLTPAQVSAVREFYRGPLDQRGRSLYNGGEPYGSELGWVGQFVEPASDQAAPGDSPEATLALNYLKYMAFLPNLPADFSLADLRFSDREFSAVNWLGNAIYNANNPDLHAFESLGGKLILYHGWADQTIPPWSTLDYYAAVERAVGGFRPSQAFSRLYMIPGAYHCLFAPDGDVNIADFLTPLMAWVQDGTAPGTVPADTITPAGTVTQTLTVAPYDATAPVTVAKGSLNGHYRYIGSY